MPISMPKIKFRYLSISEISTIKEYWNLIDQETFLATTWEPDFSQACSFCLTLMNHKKFCFKQIPDKTNDIIFLKSPNPVFGPFLTIFGHFCQLGIFSKKSGSVTRNYIWDPNTMLSLRKKMSPFWENLWTDGRTDRWKDGQTDGSYFIGLFRPRPGVQ